MCYAKRYRDVNEGTFTYIKLQLSEIRREIMTYIYILYNIVHNTHICNNPNIVFHLFSIQNKQIVVGFVIW